MGVPRLLVLSRPKQRRWLPDQALVEKAFFRYLLDAFVLEIPKEAQLIGQERAYTSPIWYSPN